MTKTKDEPRITPHRSVDDVLRDSEDGAICVPSAAGVLEIIRRDYGLFIQRHEFRSSNCHETAMMFTDSELADIIQAARS